LRPVLVVEHEAMCPPGWMGEWLERDGVALDVRRPYAGDPLPDDLAGHAGMMVLGGSMGATDDAAHSWLRRVKELIRRAADEAVPVLGICLGHQLAAVALGGSVHRNQRGQQVGLLEVGWTTPADVDELTHPLVGDQVGAMRALQWNDDIVTELPGFCMVLAYAPHGEVQAARFAPTVWGVQWHPEAGEQIVRRWAEHDRDRIRERGLDVDALVAEVATATAELLTTWRPLAGSFARVVLRTAR
jgi:GMP synthase (glutamine-hydrolysing)